MSATTQDRNTPYIDGEIVGVPVKANTVIRAGVIVCASAAGLAVEGSTAANLTYLGRADQYVDNSTGADGAKTVQVRRLKAFKWENLGTDAVTQAQLGKVCYVADNQTVAATDGAGTRSKAGIVVGIDADGVWVQ
ncbi:hypothetical protein DN523_29255 [Burkholderia multivorans]|uniref:hypothetical protein n=1 Tax=Burkholderia cepacia complex TaxID=87882 RepID=UPI000DACD387|nr:MULTISPECIES: hypothetical protein [Burkholderia cepacia complex]MBU9231436.1 hypothetical protein [Burkholderia multivorans]MDN8050325.1 hypothetical protein [Burkholderia multivorans]MDS0859938.1 hypothetical protein [Burkholderia pseudomultivorans]RAA31150.1 hypothetical protein DN471_06255 [Burkholderia multivorans]RAA32572.1 hypothetical protein DN470_01275 [Burkholderia multivorans]